jgi:predicted transcriptional regulator
MRGYSQSIIEANQNAKEGLGVLLGSVLIAKKYPVSLAAKELEVSRQTVYDWISGKATPIKSKTKIIAEMIDRLASE